MRNKFEKEVDSQIKKSRVRYSYESERIPYVLAGHYIPDFILSTKLGKVYIECKGYLRPEDKRKLLAVRRQHPNMDLRILFYAANKKQLKWAERNGIKYAIHHIPKEWFHGL